MVVGRQIQLSSLSLAKHQLSAITTAQAQFPTLIIDGILDKLRDVENSLDESHRGSAAIASKP